ncbi:hypothetical protein GCM10009718_26550 [Isoptericola halotolerans]
MPTANEQTPRAAASRPSSSTARVAAGAEGRRRPNGTVAAVMTAAWTSEVTTTRPTRPVRIAERGAGVTRIRSRAPEARSSCSPDPMKALVLKVITTSMPGTNHCSVSPGGMPGIAPTAPTRGANRTSRRTGSARDST